MESFAQLLTEVLAALGFPSKSLLEPEDAVRALRASLAFYDLQLGQSNQNQVVNFKLFTPAAREKELPDVRGVPCWLERQIGAGANSGWHFVPAVNFATIEEAWERGDEACAFYARPDGKLRVVLSYAPSGAQAHRLWYDPDPSVEVTLADSLRLPASFYPMFVARAVKGLIPVMMNTAAKLAEESQPNELMLAAWAAALDAARETLRDYDQPWRLHRLGSRGGARGRNRRTVLAR
jgi:hypothetical protein